jgi:hypothetical protein
MFSPFILALLSTFKTDVEYRIPTQALPAWLWQNWSGVEYRPRAGGTFPRWLFIRYSIGGNFRLTGALLHGV